MHQILGQQLIIVFDKCNPATGYSILGGIEYLLEEHLALLVVPMRFSCKDDLNRSPGIIENPSQPIHILQEKGRSLIRGEAPGKPQGEGGGIEQHSRGHDLAWFGTTFQPFVPRSLLYLGDQHVFHGIMVVPDDLIRNLADQLPDAALIMLLQPGPAHIAAEDVITQPAIDPGRDMNPIGDIIDGNLIHRKMRPQGLPHAPAHLSMLLAHSITVG